MGQLKDKLMCTCRYCGYDWNVAAGQKIPKRGYVCPPCEATIKKGMLPKRKPERRKRDAAGMDKPIQSASFPVD